MGYSLRRNEQDRTRLWPGAGWGNLSKAESLLGSFLPFGKGPGNQVNEQVATWNSCPGVTILGDRYHSYAFGKGSSLGPIFNKEG